MSILSKYRITEKAKQKPGAEFPGMGFIEWAKITEKQMQRLVDMNARCVEPIPTKMQVALAAKEGQKEPPKE